MKVRGPMQNAGDNIDGGLSTDWANALVATLRQTLKLPKTVVQIGDLPLKEKAMPALTSWASFKG